jgi:hypothetical protein
MSIPFPDAAKSFDGDFAVYHWGRGSGPSVIVSSALMALEAWGHRQIESGRPFGEVLHDVLGPDGSSAAFVGVGVDLALSHWGVAHEAAWPMVATPEVLRLDDARYTRDAAGVDRLLDFEREAGSWRVKRADLDVKASRRARLSDQIGFYVFKAPAARLDELRAALELARNQIAQGPRDGEDEINGLHATAERAVRMTYAEHFQWRLDLSPV